VQIYALFRVYLRLKALGSITSAIDIEQVIAELRSEFIEDAEEHISSSYGFLDGAEKDNSKIDENLLQIKRHVHSLKGQGATFGFPSITRIMHNLEDYFETAYEIRPSHLAHIRPFFDTISDIIEKRIDLSAENLRVVISKLRTDAQSFATGQEVRDIPALLVMDSGVQRSLVGKELVSCGFRVVTSNNPVEAIGVAISAQPIFAIITKQMSGISGVELAHVFKSINSISSCKIIMLTSDDDVDAIAHTVPDGTVIIHKDSTFYEKLTDQLIAWGLFGDIG
jgi:CheY-like chemotaxis protein/HPt (histidine-containing phosphotransfer) domain-containing protein